MKRVAFLISVLLCCNFLNTAYADSEPVQSTEGIELEGNVEKAVSDSEIKKERAEKKKATRLYFKYKKAILKQNKKRLKKEKEIMYLEERLNTKKERLETLSPESEKGETEE